MIVVDVETGGLYPQHNALLSIGAIEFENPKNKFYVELKPLDSKQISKEAIKVNDYNPNWENIPHNIGMKMFYDWIKKIKNTTLAGHNPAFDRDFCNYNFEICKLPRMFDFRTVDLHTLAYMKFGESLSANRIYHRLGMIREPDPHNALNGAIWEYFAFKKLMDDVKV